ncbi:MAG TPA: hypothetical protein VNH19_22970, partial [Candidatus Limnocylindrales bacterium]|nr:hypothetical protein [Candidatus Limnocylindrales bacterium]
MNLQPLLRFSARLILLGCLVGAFSPGAIRAQGAAQAKPACRVEPVDYFGWSAQQLSNQWVRLI